MNDHSEYHNGSDVIKQVFTDKSSTLDEIDKNKINAFLDEVLGISSSAHTFILSLSSGKDLLSQWRGYCPKTGGYALEFEIPDDSLIFSEEFKLRPCIYEESKKIDEASSLFERTRSHMLQDSPRKSTKLRTLATIWSNIASFKHHGFQEEREYRVPIFHKKNMPVKFRTRDSLIIPYIEIDLPHDKLKSIIIGPCQDFDLAKKGLELFMGSISDNPLKSENITIIKSDVPYRV